MADMTQILALLIDRSRNRKLAWRTTASPNAFLTTLGEVSVAVSMISRGIDDPHYELEILDQQGRSVESLTTSRSGLFGEPNPDAKLHNACLKQLFEFARRSALDVDSTLDELIRELDAIG